MAQKTVSNLLFFSLLTAFSAIPALYAAAQPGTNRAVPPVTPPLERPAFLDSCPDKPVLSPLEIITTALVFSGCDPDSPLFAQSVSKFEAFVQTITAPAVLEQPVEERGNTVLEMMHASLLKRYSLNQTRLDTLLQNGTYNCVSSGILYLAAARAAGMEVYGVGTDAHAFCVVQAGEQQLDVETTNRYGFNPGTKKEFHDSFGKTTGFAYVPAKNYARRAQTPDRAYLGFILGNRSTYYGRSGNFQDALPLAAARAEYTVQDGGVFYADALSELHKLCVNYTVYLQRHKRFAESLAYAEYAINTRGFSGIWQESTDGLVHNAVSSYLNTDDTGTAEKYTAAWKNRISEAKYAELASLIFIKGLEKTSKTLMPEEQLSYLAAAERLPEAQNSGTQQIITRMKEHAWIQIANTHSANKDFLAAVQIIDEGIAREGETANLKKARNIFGNNYCAAVHNNFAALFNSKQYEKAHSVLQEGLRNFPANSMLKKDLSTVLREINRHVP